LALALLAAAAAVFCKVSEIEVRGSKRYSAAEIIAASEIREDANLVLLDTGRIGKKIRTQMPYIASTEVRKILPGTVIIEVEESDPAAAIASGGKCCIVDKSVRILEIADMNGARGLIAIQGAEPILPKAGEKVALGETESTKLAYLEEALGAICSAGIEDKVTWLDVSNISAMTFDYDGRFTVDAGRGENMSEKVGFLLGIVAKLEPTDRGTIDISNESEGRFVPG